MALLIKDGESPKNKTADQIAKGSDKTLFMMPLLRLERELTRNYPIKISKN